MNKVINWLKNINFRQIVTGLMAAVLLFVSSACSNTPSVLAKTADQVREEVPSQAVTSTHEGGMNEYSDTDPRQTNSSRAQSRADELEKSAQQRLKNRTGNPAEAAKRVVEDAPENAVEIGEDAKRAAAKMGENAKAGAERVKENTEKFLDKARGDVEESMDTAASKAGNVGKSAKRAAEDVSDAAKAKVKSDVKSTQRTLEDVADSVD